MDSKRIVFVSSWLTRGGWIHKILSEIFRFQWRTQPAAMMLWLTEHNVWIVLVQWPQKKFVILHPQEIAGVFRNLRKVELRLRSEYTVQIFPLSLHLTGNGKKAYYLIVLKGLRVPVVNSCVVSTIGRHPFQWHRPFFDTQVMGLVSRNSGVVSESRKFGIKQFDEGQISNVNR